ncbi:MAG: hypothetical protein NTX25_13665 [Proteobacteria bacterium]|nr:hypothetical protein [Pseudomonadota bacterium]
MPSLKPEIFEMDRRQLLKLTGTMGIGASFISPAALFAAGECDKLDTSPGPIVAEGAGATLQYWIDGIHFGSRSNLKTRANITLFMNLTQSEASFVESVVLLDANKATIGARYFDASMKMNFDKNYVPYVRFENLELDPSATYTTIYSVRTGSTLKLYTSSIVKPTISTLNTTFLPQQMRRDFQKFLTGDTVNPTPGLITTPFQFYTRNGLSAHCARGRVTEMASDGSSFKVNIDFMHADVTNDHFMRYFIVMDPVGRILGFHRRLAAGDGGISNGAIDVMRIDDQKRADFNVPDLQIANIAHCPYIQIYAEDSYDAIARNLLRLR